MLVKTHLIVTDKWDDYEIKWVKRLIDTKPKLDSNGYPTFVILSNKGRIEIKTFDLKYIEEQAKKATLPRGRASVTKDQGYILIKEEKEEVLIGIVNHTHTRKYAPMYDEIP